MQPPLKKLKFENTYDSKSYSDIESVNYPFILLSAFVKNCFENELEL